MKIIKIKIDNIYFDCNFKIEVLFNGNVIISFNNVEQLYFFNNWLNVHFNEDRIGLKSDYIKDIYIYDEDWNERIINSAFIKNINFDDNVVEIGYDYFDINIIRNCQLEFIKRKIDKIKFKTLNEFIDDNIVQL